MERGTCKVHLIIKIPFLGNLIAITQLTSLHCDCSEGSSLIPQTTLKLLFGEIRADSQRTWTMASQL